MQTELARRLSALRLRSGLSQREVAERVNISTQSCSHYETGWRTPTIYTLFGFAQLYQVTPEYLLGYTNDLPDSQLPTDLHTLSLPKLVKLYDFLNFISFSPESDFSESTPIHTISCPQESLGKRLRLFRKQSHLSQSDMAQALGITVQAYSHYETEQRIPSPEIFYRIAQILHLSMCHLFTGEPDIIVNINKKLRGLSEDELTQVNNYILYLKCQP